MHVALWQPPSPCEKVKFYWQSSLRMMYLNKIMEIIEDGYQIGEKHMASPRKQQGASRNIDPSRNYYEGIQRKQSSSQFRREFRREH
ncbi:hypothetical protein TNCV_288971 [Trichonephila clavipes]|nr:hypothetical protein TNCV_288971 [Trichonephila clavipes]